MGGSACPFIVVAFKVCERCSDSLIWAFHCSYVRAHREMHEFCFLYSVVSASKMIVGFQNICLYGNESVVIRRIQNGIMHFITRYLAENTLEHFST